MISDKVGNYILIDTNIFAQQTRLLRTGLDPTLLYLSAVLMCAMGGVERPAFLNPSKAGKRLRPA